MRTLSCPHRAAAAVVSSSRARHSSSGPRVSCVFATLERSGPPSPSSRGEASLSSLGSPPSRALSARRRFAPFRGPSPSPRARAPSPWPSPVGSRSISSRAPSPRPEPAISRSRRRTRGSAGEAAAAAAAAAPARVVVVVAFARVVASRRVRLALRRRRVERRHRRPLVPVVRLPFRFDAEPIVGEAGAARADASDHRPRARGEGRGSLRETATSFFSSRFFFKAFCFYSRTAVLTCSDTPGGPAACSWTSRTTRSRPFAANARSPVCLRSRRRRWRTEKTASRARGAT